MIDLLLILRWPLLALALFSALYWLAVLLRVRRASRSVPTVRAGLDAPLEEPAPKVSVVIPAHNEAEVIDQCAAGIAAQDYPDLEFVFVLDRCTDDTRQRLARAAGGDDRFVIEENDACPPDWAGKCNAARIGADRATGDLLLFTDADTFFDPSLIRAAVGLMRKRDLDLLSLLSTLETSHWFERIVQPVASMSLVRLYPIDRVNRPGSRRAFANGQFMLFTRTMYERVGGHVAVKNDLLEDIALARHVTRHNGRTGLFLDDGMLRCAMYDSYGAFREGWKRILIEACKRRTSRLWKNGSRLFMIGVLEPLVHAGALGVAAGLAAEERPDWAALLGGAALLAIGLKLGALAWAYRLAGSPRWGVVAHPVGAWCVARVFFEAARQLQNRTPVRWGGREYVIEPRPRHAPPM